MLVTVIVISCQKDKGTSNSIIGTSTQAVVVKPPTADFTISNPISPGTVWEALTLNLINASQNANSYY